MNPCRELKHKTENELREQAVQLRQIVRAGDATIDQANQLAEIETMLRRFEAVAAGKAF